LPAAYAHPVQSVPLDGGGYLPLPPHRSPEPQLDPVVRPINTSGVSQNPKKPRQPCLHGADSSVSFHADALCASRDFPDSSLEPVQCLRRNDALDLRASRKAEPEKFSIMRSRHRTPRLIHIEPELLPDELRNALHHPLPARSLRTKTLQSSSNKALAPPLPLPVSSSSTRWLSSGESVPLRSPFHVRTDQPVLHHFGIQVCPNEVQQPLVLDSFGDLTHRFVVIGSIETSPDQNQPTSRGLRRYTSAPLPPPAGPTVPAGTRSCSQRNVGSHCWMKRSSTVGMHNFQPASPASARKSRSKVVPG
jgi:hypothetical protein